jgi:hypothetical protein
MDHKEHHRRRRHHRRHHAVAVQFSGIDYTNEEGEFILSVQQIPTATAGTVALWFYDKDGNFVDGPVGVVTSDNPAVLPTLSADGQTISLTSAAVPGELMLMWHDPAGKVPDASTTFATVSALQVPPIVPPAPGEAASVAFGPFYADVVPVTGGATATAPTPYPTAPTPYPTAPTPYPTAAPPYPVTP